MFSSTTTLLSTSMPTASIRPLREITLSEKLSPPTRRIRYTTVKVAMMEMGMAMATTSVARTFNRKANSTSTARPAPISPELRRLLRLLVISSD